MDDSHSHAGGFTLIELSIVLVIIGLLVGGVLAGREMIRQAQLRTFIKDVNTFNAAIFTFRVKYNETPGDMSDATTYWGTNPNCIIVGSAGAGTQTCNGNGNGIIDNSGNNPIPPEQFLIWQHLGNAGLVAGTYSGTSDRYCHFVPGTNAPRGPLGDTHTYFIAYLAQGNPGAGWWYSPKGSNWLYTGSSLNTAYPGYPILSAQEAYNLDMKVDDGLPASGMWFSFGGPGAAYDNNCAVNGSTGLALPDGSQASEAVAAYNTSTSGVICSFQIMMNF